MQNLFRRKNVLGICFRKDAIHKFHQAFSNQQN